MKWILILAVITGCVSKTKYSELEIQTKDTEIKMQALQGQVEEQKAVIQQLQNKLGMANSDVEQMKIALSELRERRKETEKRIKEYQELTKRFGSLVNSGQLSVKIVDGRMVLVLPSDVLFSSGSAKLSTEGESSIKTVAKLLKSIDKKFQIEGHTDNVPIKSTNYPSNWELASARALTVAKTMIGQGMDAKRISAASFGEYKPAGDNSTDAGKSLNRRVEIVIMPDLSQLPGFDELEKLQKQEDAK